MKDLIYMDEEMMLKIGLQYYGVKGQQVELTGEELITLRKPKYYDEDHIQIFQLCGMDTVLLLTHNGLGWFTYQVA